MGRQRNKNNRKKIINKYKHTSIHTTYVYYKYFCTCSRARFRSLSPMNVCICHTRIQYAHTYMQFRIIIIVRIYFYMVGCRRLSRVSLFIFFFPPIACIYYMCIQYHGNRIPTIAYSMQREAKKKFCVCIELAK